MRAKKHSDFPWTTGKSATNAITWKSFAKLPHRCCSEGVLQHIGYKAPVPLCVQSCLLCKTIRLLLRWQYLQVNCVSTGFVM